MNIFVTHIYFRVPHNFLKHCREIFATDLSLSNFMLVVERKFLTWQIVPHQLFPIVTEKSFLVWDYSITQMAFFSIFPLYPTIVINTWMNLLDAADF